jgi:hypothetical protein
MITTFNPDGSVTTRDMTAAEVAEIASYGPVLKSPEEQLAEKRASATRERGPLCLALYNEGILSGSSALAASKGNWPSEFDAFLANLTPVEQLGAQIAWADATVVRYQTALLQDAAISYAGTPEAATALLDQLFGIAAE